MRRIGTRLLRRCEDRRGEVGRHVRIGNQQERLARHRSEILDYDTAGHVDKAGQRENRFRHLCYVITDILDPGGRTPGRTIASQAIAAGEPAVSSSFRFHRPRGPICGDGYCAQCEIATPRGRVLACQSEASEESPAHRRDLLRPLGLAAERFPPWFYERRFLRPKRLRRLPLHVLRHLSSAGALAPVGATAAPKRFAELEVEVAVVGSADVPGAFRVDLAAGDLALGLYPERTLGVLTGDRLLAVRFERLVVATGSYVRLPPVPGNDLPGIVSLDAAERYARSGALRAGTRMAVWTPDDGRERAEQLSRANDLEIVWMSDAAPSRICGRGRVDAIEAAGRIACDLVVVGVRQPALELAVQGGARAALTEGGLPIVALGEAPEWMDVRGAAAARTSGVPDVPSADAAFACLCEDVRVRDIRACVEQGFRSAELVKRRTGAMTGPCQGKLCTAAVLATLRDMGVAPEPTRSRAPARPVALSELAADA
jgi:hypothetical protein